MNQTRFEFKSSVPQKKLISQKKWGEAYKRGKRKEFRWVTLKWIESRFGCLGKFVWGWGSASMKFNFPESHMTSEYGCFDSLDLFWEAFNSNDTWASEFYTKDGLDDSGREGFKNFVLEQSKTHPNAKCLWFRPQPTGRVVFFNTQKTTPSPSV